MSNFPVLPQEIIIRVIDEVPFDPKFFSACSTLNRSFTVACQQRLYREIGVVSFNGLQRCQQLHKLLSRCPHIALYIRKFSLWTGLRRGDGLGQRGAIWLFHEPAIPLLIDLMQSLQSFELKSSGPTITWEEMSVSLKQSFGRLFSLPSLSEVTIVNARLPVALLAQPKQLKHLGIRRSRLDRSNPDPDVDFFDWTLPIAALPRIHSLSITSAVEDAPITDNLSLAVDLSNLRELIIFSSDRTLIEDAHRILLLSAASLERLKWDMPKTFELIGVPDLTCPLFLTPKLRCLEVGVHDWYHNEEVINPVSWAVRALKDLAASDTGATCLESVTIWILTMPYYAYGEGIKQSPWWSQLDGALSQRKVFSRLRRLRVFFDNSLEGEDREYWIGAFAKQFSSLLAQEVLVQIL